MKKVFCSVLLCLAALALGVCPFSAADTGAAEAAEAPGPQAVDLDLSVLSGTVVYSQVYNMMYEPEPWLGKIIRMAGFYSAYEDTEKGIVYHACVIPDATACCAQGIEFVWGGEHAWPDDYPEEGTDIIVTGRLEVYDEDGYKYLHLTDAELKLEESGNS